MEKLEFIPSNISNIFKNIYHKSADGLPSYDFAWDVKDNERFVGELFYSLDFKEWVFIKDNYPSPRIAYKTSFPMDLEIFIKHFKSIGITLLCIYD